MYAKGLEWSLNVRKAMKGAVRGTTGNRSLALKPDESEFSMED